MSLLDQLSGLISQNGGVQGVLNTVLNQSGGMSGILDKLNQSGFGPQVNSWLGKGANQPITADEVQAALGNDKLKQMAGSLGISLDQVSGLIAQHLPAAVDAASPNGTLQG